MSDSFILDDVLLAVNIQLQSTPVVPTVADVLGTWANCYKPLGYTTARANQFGGRGGKGQLDGRKALAPLDFASSVVEKNALGYRTAFGYNLESIRSMVFECDNAPIEASVRAAWAVFNRLRIEPSLIVFTGNKSVHFILVFKEPIALAEYNSRYLCILDKLNKQSGFEWDDAFLNNALQLSTFPNSFHEKSRRYAAVVGGSCSYVDFTKLPEVSDYILSESALVKSLAEKGIAKANKTQVTTEQLRTEYNRLQKHVSQRLGVAEHWFETAYADYANEVKTTVRRGKNWKALYFVPCLKLALKCQPVLDSEQMKAILSSAKETLAAQESKNMLNENDITRTYLQGAIAAMTRLHGLLNHDINALSAPATPATYCSEYKLDLPGIVLIKSGTGTGKTQALVKQITQLLLDEPSASVLCICPRRQLVEQALAQFPPGFVDYRQLMKQQQIVFTSNLLVNSVDSVYKIGKKAYDYVIIDEVALAFSHLFTGTTAIKDNRLVCKDTIRSLLLRCKTAWLVSADLSDLEVDVVKTMVGDKQPITIYNNTQPMPENLRKDIMLLGTPKQAYKKVEEAIVRGGRVFVALDSRARATRLFNHLTRMFPDSRMQLVTARTESVVNVAEFYDKDVVICSPSLATGYDISDFDDDTPSYFTDVVLVFANNTSSIPVGDLMQQLARVRYCKTVYCHIDERRWFDERQVKKAVAAQMIGKSEAALSYISYVDGLPTVTTHDAECQYLQGRYITRNVYDSQMRRGRFVSACLAKGHTIIDETTTYQKHSESSIDEVMEQALIDEARQKAIVEAPVISNETKDELEARAKVMGKLEPIQQAALDQYYVRMSLLLGDQLPTVEDVQYYDGLFGLASADLSQELEAAGFSHKGSDLTPVVKGRTTADLLKLKAGGRAYAEKKVADALDKRNGIHGDLSQNQSLRKWAMITDMEAALANVTVPYTNSTLAEAGLLAVCRKHEDVFGSCGIKKATHEKQLAVCVNSFYRAMGYYVHDVRMSSGKQFTPLQLECHPATALKARIDQAPVEQLPTKAPADIAKAIANMTDEEFDKVETQAVPVAAAPRAQQQELAFAASLDDLY
jgi:Origin of replication binding protein